MTLLRWLFRWRRQHDDLTREMQAHIAERADALIEDGVAEAEAWAQARREFGNIALQAERSRETWIAPLFTSVWQDLRYAVRSLARQPGFALSAVGILAIGMGLLSTLFTIVNVFLLRPWPVDDPSSVAIVRPLPLRGQQHGLISAPEYRYLREHSRSFTHLAAWLGGGALIRFEGTTANAQTNYVTSNYFDALRVAPSHGRLFQDADEDYVQPRPVAVISHRLWRSLGSGPDVAGKVLFVDRTPFTIVGVTAPEFRLRSLDVWIPLPSIALVHPSSNDTNPFNDPNSSFASGIFGRLAGGATHQTAKAELDGLGAQFKASVSATSAGFTLHDTRPFSQDAAAVARDLPVVGLSLGALFLVMLLACANVGNMILARGMARARETAIRLSLGAGRGRLARQFLTEAACVSAVAAAAGLWIGWALPLSVVSLFRAAFEFETALLAPDAASFAFAAVMALLATVVSGLTPALRLSRRTLAQQSSYRSTSDRGAGRLRTAFLAVQIALSMVLLVSAGLLTRAIGYGLSADPGFAIDEVEAVTFSLSDGGAERRAAFHRALARDLSRADLPPFAFSEFPAITTARRQTTARRTDERIEIARDVIERAVSSSYFRTLGIPLIAGRPPADDTEVVVNQTAARVLWQDADPLGQPISLGRNRAFTIVGVSADVPVVVLRQIDAVVYVPDNAARLLLVRHASPGSLERIQAIARSIEPSVGVTSRPLADDLRMSVQGVRAGSYFTWGLGMLALLLATTGAFAVFAYTVEERRHEIGVRMALGASRRSVVGTVIDGARRPLTIGLCVGAIISMGAAQLLRNQLYGLSPFDPITYVGIAAILTFAALVATWIPARRATRIDPAVTLRGD